jgi:hypothetical protein
MYTQIAQSLCNFDVEWKFYFNALQKRKNYDDEKQICRIIVEFYSQFFLCMQLNYVAGEEYFRHVTTIMLNICNLI